MDAPLGYRNGWGKPWQLSLTSGSITLRRPRVRGLEARFESRLQEVGRLLPELYLPGLAHGGFDLALRGLLGEAAPLSGASIARLKAGWQAEYEAWKRRRLDEFERVYIWADAIYVKAGLEKDKPAMLVLVAVLRDGRKVILAVERESIESWAALLRDLKARGLRAPRLLIADGHRGVWGAVTTVFPEVAEQRCWNHRIVNVLDTLSQKLQAEGRALLTQIPYAETRAEAEEQKGPFQAWATKKGVPAAGRRLAEDWDRLMTFYAFPKAHWKHLRTTNAVESPFAAVRLRTAAAKRFKRVDNATAVSEYPGQDRSNRCSWPSRASGASMRRSSCRRSPRASRMSTASEQSGATRRRPPDLVYTLLDKTSRPAHGGFAVHRAVGHRPAPRR